MPNTTTASNRNSIRFLAVLFIAWVTYFSISALSKGPSVPYTLNLDALGSARSALSAIYANTGQYPSTQGAWVALPGTDTFADYAVPDSFFRLVGQAVVWEGSPPSALLYRSDGKDFKLIFHNPGDCTAIHALRPDLVDPVRTAYSRGMLAGGWEVILKDERTIAPIKNPMIKEAPGIMNPLYAECWACGIWSQGGVFW